MPYRFRPNWIPSVATLVLLPVLIALGFWQLDRAEQKRALQSEYDRRALAPAAAITSDLVAPETLRFYPVIAKGYYEPMRQILIDNRVHAGQAGYHVITPLRVLDSETRVLVNRGWVPMGRDRAHLPPAPAPAGLQEVQGVAIVPASDVFTLGKPETDWQPVWQYLDMDRYRSLAGFPLQPIVVLLDPSSPSGFVRDWARLDSGIATHQGYALQWFSLAAATLVLFVALNLRKFPDSKR